MRLFPAAAVIVLLVAVVLQVFLRAEKQGPERNGTNGGLKHQGYFEVFESAISTYFRSELASNGNLSTRDWTANSAHIFYAAQQSNVIVVPHAVENPRAYYYDPSYVDACVENGLSMVLFVHTLAKYVYFLDPRPTTAQERRELLLQEMRIYEEKFRPYKEHIVAIYVYDEPWVSPWNVTPGMVVEMCDVARGVFWNKPVMVVFHRQGNSYSYTLPNGTLVRYDEWIGQTPEACDIIGVDPYFYAYHDGQPPDYRHTGDQGIVESDVSWACSFGKPVVLIGQAFDPGSSPFFGADNTDPEFSVSEGFEAGRTDAAPEGWRVEGSGIKVTGRISHKGNNSLLLDGALGSSAAVFGFRGVHSAKAAFYFAVEPGGSPDFWVAVGDGDGEPVRLGFRDREMLIDDGMQVEIINRSVDVRPGVWHSVVIGFDADAYRWTVWFDGEPQTRLPYARLPETFSQLRLIADEGSAKVWVDDLEVWREWSFIPLDEKETMLYYDVAHRHPEVEMLLWYNYRYSFASSLVRNREQYQVADVWATQRKIWEMIS